MEAGFAESQERAVTDAVDAPATSEAELEQMVVDALCTRRIFSKVRLMGGKADYHEP